MPEVRRQQLCHVVEGELLCINCDCRGFSAEFPFHKSAMNIFRSDGRTRWSRARSQSIELNWLFRSSYLERVYEAYENRVVRPETAIDECVEVPLMSWRFNSRNRPIDRGRARSETDVHERISIVAMVRLIDPMRALEDPATVIAEIDGSNCHGNPPPFEDFSNGFGAKGVCESRLKCSVTAPEGGWAPYEIRYDRSETGWNSAREDQLCVPLVERNDLGYRDSCHQGAANDGAGTRTNDQVKPFADIQFSSSKALRETGGQATQVLRRVNTTHAPAVETEYAEGTNGSRLERIGHFQNIQPFRHFSQVSIRIIFTNDTNYCSKLLLLCIKTLMESPGSEKSLRRGIEQRLEFIDFRLFWEGKINRSDIVNHFRISVPQASKDLSLYESLAPQNMDYDTSGKRYLASQSFSPRFFIPSADQYLSELRSNTDHTSDPADTWLGVVPSAEAMPIPQRRVNVDVLRSVVGAIKNQRSLHVFYQSMNKKRPGPMWRWVSPHALAHDGLRWHIRAFCHEEGRFKDFVLSRCLSSRETRSTEIDAAQDEQWNQYFSVVLVPNPALSEEQQELIAQDYCMEYGQIAIAVRKALLYYFNKRLRLDVAQALDDPKETPVVVLNEKAFKDVLAELG